MNNAVILNVLAVVLFLVAAVLVLVQTPIDWEMLAALGFGGLAAHSAAHLPV